MWEIATVTNPKARKDYLCDAFSIVINAGLGEAEYSENEWAAIEKAKRENGKIIKGTKYTKTEGKYDGVFGTFRAREDMNEICITHGFYEE